MPPMDAWAFSEDLRSDGPGGGPGRFLLTNVPHFHNLRSIDFQAYPARGEISLMVKN